MDSPSNGASRHAHPGWLSVSLSFVAGYVDTLGFVALFGLFTAHVTGNFVLIGSELAHPVYGITLKLLAFPAFILAVVVARLVTLGYERRNASPLKPLLLFQAILFTLFLVAGVMASPIKNPDAPMTIVAGLLGAAAMGIQNAQGRLTLASLVPTTIMTGNVTQLIIDVTDCFHPVASELRTKARERIGKMLPAILAFTVGTIAGALGYVAFSFWCLLLPIVLLLTLTIL